MLTETDRFRKPIVPGGSLPGESDASPSLSILQRVSIDRLLGLWDHLVDPRVGIIRKVEELPIDDDEPDFIHYLSTACDTARFTALSNFGNNGGVSSNRYVAIAKAMGEAIERYCSAIFRYDELVISPYRDLEQPATPPESFALYRPEQFDNDAFPWHPFDHDAPVSWVKGRSLASGADVLVPAAMVYVPFHFIRSRGDAPICQPISTGLAAGCSFAEAALSGLCEVVERDAFTLTWQARMSRPTIAGDGLPGEVIALLRRFWSVSLDVKLVDITTDLGIPTAMTIAVGDKPTSPAIAVAAAADPSPVRAIIKSLEELAHTRKFSRQVMEYTPALPNDPTSAQLAVQDQRHHLRLYCPQAAKAFIRFAWESADVRYVEEMPGPRGTTPQHELDGLVGQIRALGYEVIACDLTTPDIAALGLSVVRVVVPGLHPLFMGYQNRALGGNRLYEIPQKLGHLGLAPGQADNPYPHPFP